MAFHPAGIRTVRIEARDRTPEQIGHIVRAWRRAERMPQEPDEAQQAWLHEQEGADITRGHYFRGVL
jgi:putative protease